MQNEDNIHDIFASPATDKIVMLPGIYNDTLRLLMETHEYFQYQGTVDHERIQGAQRLVYSCEMSRITTRLSSVMAWLMVQKAWFGGSITDDEARTRFPLDAPEVCLYHNREAETMLPKKMIELLAQSLELYQRVNRLDVMLRQSTVH